MNPLQIEMDRHKIVNRLENHIKSLPNADKLNILEAGCGRRWPLYLMDVKYEITGVDKDIKALEIRRDKINDLDKAIVADLTDFDIKGKQYDVIYNSMVLEHIKNAAQVMKNFASMLRPGGLLILRIPDRESAYGWCTRILPFWIHVVFKKYIQGVHNAGKPGYDPYPTFFDKSISRSGIHDFCSTFGFKILEEIGSSSTLTKNTFRSRIVKNIEKMLCLLSFCRLSSDHNNLTYVLLKKFPV